MKHNQILRRGLGILLSLVLCLGLLPATALAEGEDAEVSPKAIQLGADCISGYDSETGYDYLYYGYWNSDDTKAYSGPIKWLVLDDQTNTGADGLFLLSEAVLGSGDYGNVYFNQSAHKADGIWYKGAEHDGGHENCQLANAWQGSDGQAWCRDFYGSSLTEQEQAAVLATTKSDGEYGTYWFSRYILFSASDDILKDDTVFFLSTEEAENGAYGFPDNASRSAVYDGQDTRWWLRSPLSEGTSTVGVVHTKGVVATWTVYSDWAARPAFNLDPDAVVFASAAEGGKSASGMGSGLASVGDYTGNEWKLTLLDSSRSGFTASTETVADNKVTIAYSNAATGENEYISAIVKDAYGNVYNYGRIAQLDGTTNGASGTVEIDLSGIDMTDKTLCVFNEQYNGDKKTDYASNFCTVDITTYTVRFNANGGSGEMDAVTGVSGSYTLPTTTTFTPPEGKQFKGWATSATGEVISGATITVNGDTTLYAIWEDIPAATCNQTADFTIGDGSDALALLNGAKTEGAADSTWDSTNTILTLNGVDFTTSAATAVRLPDGAKIVLAEGTENTITSTYNGSGSGSSYGIYANGGLTIEGSGKLTATGGTAEYSSGIYAEDGNLTISDCTLTATGGTAENWSCGIEADGDADISSGTVTAKGGTAEVSIGIYAGDYLYISGGTVIAAGSDITGENSESYGIYVDNEDITISGEKTKVTVTGGTADSASYGIFTYSGYITIKGGTVTATGGNVDLYSYGIYADGAVTISGGTVTATGGEATGEESESYGICAYDDMDISGGTVTATGGNATGDASKSSGLYGRGYFENNEVIGGNITISGGTVKATGGNVDLYSDGIYADGAVTISGGTITATGGEVTDEASESFGIESYVSETIIISGGHVTARTLTTTAWTKSALNKAPNLSGYTGYQWRTSASGDFTSSADTAYTYRESDTYVEFSSQNTVTTYAITVDSAKNGDVTTSHKTASKGTTVTLTVEPDKGFELDTLTVTDGSGKKVSVTEKSGKYTFTMPASKVTVKATFAEIVAEPENPFVDVADDAYYFDAVLWAAENGITGGVDDTHFAPNVTCTRAQAVTFLWRAAGSPAPKSSEMPFEDVAAGSYYYDAVLWAVNEEITNGMTDTTFEPTGKCTRGQAVTFLWRAAGCPEPTSTVNPFEDVVEGKFYYKAVLWAVENGITKGTSETTFDPNGTCTRAQIVTFLFRCLGEE